MKETQEITCLVPAITAESDKPRQWAESGAAGVIREPPPEGQRGVSALQEPRLTLQEREDFSIII